MAAPAPTPNSGTPAGALHEQNALLRKLTEHLPAVVFQYRRSPDGWESMPYATEGLRRVYGVAPAEVRESARPMYLRVHPDDRAQLSASVADSARRRAPWRFEFRVFGPDGALRWHEGHASAPEPLDDGSLLWHGYIVDISERKRYEEAVVNAEAAQRANAAKTEFLSRMSHELRTPLNAVIGFAQLLQIDPEQPLAERQRARVEHIERAGAQLLAMVEQLLAGPGASAAGLQGLTPAPPGARTVLYAEDNPLNVELMRQVLGLRPGLRLLVARNGAEALGLMAQESPDLLLLDMHLGDMSALELVSRLRAAQPGALPPCVALSADVLPARIEQALAAGFAEYLLKPLDMRALMRCLDRRLA